jgi:hypothetical protein
VGAVELQGVPPYIYSDPSQFFLPPAAASSGAVPAQK